MITLVPRDSLMGTLAGPLLWSAHFVLSYLIAGTGCSLGYGTARLAGLPAVQWLLIATGGVIAALLLVAGFQAERGRRRENRRAVQREAADAERRRFLYTVAGFLCGLSLVGTLWLTLNAVLVPPC